MIDHYDEPETLSQTIAEFAANTSFDSIPSDVVARAKLLMLDCIGIGMSAARSDVATHALHAIGALSDGTEDKNGMSSVIGLSNRYSSRDSALLNGILISALDYSDTHFEGAIHISASSFPAALAVCQKLNLSGRDLVLGYVTAIEVGCRVASAANGGFHEAGFAPTGIAGALGASVGAARLWGLRSDEIVHAQGFAGSFAAGSLEFLETGAWTDYVNAGWAAACGLTGAAFAAAGFTAPPRIYEGRYGLFASHIGNRATFDVSRIVRGLGDEWESRRVAIKQYPRLPFQPRMPRRRS